MLQLLDKNFKQTWGLKWYDVYSDDFLIRMVEVNNAYYDREKARWEVGLNVKFLKECQNEGVRQIRVKIHDKEFPMNVPDEKILKQKDKLGEYKDFQAMYLVKGYAGSLDMRVYYFIV